MIVKKLVISWWGALLSLMSLDKKNWGKYKRDKRDKRDNKDKKQKGQRYKNTGTKMTKIQGQKGQELKKKVTYKWNCENTSLCTVGKVRQDSKISIYKIIFGDHHSLKKLCKLDIVGRLLMETLLCGTWVWVSASGCV